MEAQTLCNRQHNRLVKYWKAIKQRAAVRIVGRISCQVTIKLDMSTIAKDYSFRKNDEAQTVPMDILKAYAVFCKMLRGVRGYRSFIGSILKTSTFRH
jgi:hypothetical protein